MKMKKAKSTAAILAVMALTAGFTGVQAKDDAVLNLTHVTPVDATTYFVNADGSEIAEALKDETLSLGRLDVVGEDSLLYVQNQNGEFRVNPDGVSYVNTNGTQTMISGDGIAVEDAAGTKTTITANTIGTQYIQGERADITGDNALLYVQNQTGEFRVNPDGVSYVNTNGTQTLISGDGIAVEDAAGAKTTISANTIGTQSIQAERADITGDNALLYVQNQAGEFRVNNDGLSYVNGDGVFMQVNNDGLAVENAAGAKTVINGDSVKTGTVDATDVNVVGGDLYVQTNQEDGTTGAEFHVRQSDGLTYMRNLADGGLSTFNVGDDGLTYMRNLADGGLSTFNVGDTGATFTKTSATGEKKATTIDGDVIKTGTVKAENFTVTSNGEEINVGDTFANYQDAGIKAGTVKEGVNNSIAVGEGSYVGSNQSTALGEYAMISDAAEQSVALGTNTLVYSANSVALGYNSVADRANTVSVGSKGNERQITNVAAGTEDTDAVNVGQLNERFSSYEDGGVVAGTVKDGVNNSIAVGEGSYVGSNQSTALGEYAMISDAAEQSVALGTNTLVYSANSVALGYNSVADRANTVSVGSAGNERQITNVAAGTERTDAVNVGQLQDALSNVGIDAEGGNVVQADKDGNVTIDGNLDVNGGLTVGDTVISGEDLAGVADISGIKTDVKTNASNITALQDKVGSGDIKVKDANGSAVTNLTDAVNANYTQIQNNSNAISSLGNRVSDLGDEIDSVGAISAALAGLHPLDYDGTGSKFQISAAMGTYDGTQAAAIGGFYHFNRDVMLSLGGATSFEGDKKTAANIGVTFRVGEGASGKSVSDDVMARLEAMDQKIAALEQENKDLKNVLGAIDTSLSKEFPDVPANHWAYEAVSKLAGNDIVAGYPDGEFHGDRTMTRYEMAEIIYKAMSKGVQVDQKLVNEFKPEMEQVAANQNA